MNLSLLPSLPFRLALYFVISIPFGCQADVSNEGWTKHALEYSTYQMRNAALCYSPDQIPRSCDLSGKVAYADTLDWTVGFFPGNLWYAYDLTRDSFFIEHADRYTRGLASAPVPTSTHDLGFMFFCSYGNGFRITGNEAYAREIMQASDNLIRRFNSTVGAIRSWDFGSWEYPVIIDNLMNLEMLFWASEYSGNPLYRDIALKHARTTLIHHLRDDYSVYHLVDFDSVSGKAIIKQTHQGYSNESTWTRGQAWALYGFSMIYKYTGDPTFLKHAERIASFIISHKRMPDDFVPYWDLDDPEIPRTYRDASSASIMASAYLTLSCLVEGDRSDEYFRIAEQMLRSLCSDNYLSKKGENGYFILKHSVGNLPGDQEVDVSINYADYYFLEALTKYMELKR